MVVLTNTWVRGVRVSEVKGKTTFMKATINAPEIMRFEWGTQAVKSEEGFWKLVRIGPRMGQEQLLASGVSHPATGGTFYIDLRQYLPPKAPSPAIVYHVRVVPRTKAKSSQSTTGTGQTGAKVPAKMIGSWSQPVVITYAASTSSQTFEFPEVYRQARLYLDGFRIIQDQIGSGQEEYHIAGFVQELLWSQDDGGKFNRPGRQIKIGPYSRVMNPPMTTVFKPGPFVPHNQFWDFNLNTKKEDWPRRLAVVISVMEEDNGNKIGAWKIGIDGMQDFAKTPGALNKSKKELVDYISKHGFDGIKFFLDAANTLYAVITNNAAVAGPVLLVGTFVTLAVLGVWAIWEDSEDDYYGTSSGVLTLSSNRVEEVHKLAGTLKGSGGSARYVLKPQTLRFKGPPGATQAASFDGIVEFTYHWEFTQRALE
jgi:hypothetical protein